MDTCFSVRHTSMSLGSIGTPINYRIPKFIPHVISPLPNQYKYILSRLHKNVNKNYICYWKNFKEVI